MLVFKALLEPSEYLTHNIIKITMSVKYSLRTQEYIYLI